MNKMLRCTRMLLHASRSCAGGKRQMFDNSGRNSSYLMKYLPKLVNR